MTAGLSFARAGASANIDFYPGADPAWSVEVLVDSARVVDGRLVRRRPAEYVITVKERLAGDGWVERARFSYVPARDPDGLHLPDRTVTRLVRAKLAEGTKRGEETSS